MQVNVDLFRLKSVPDNLISSQPISLHFLSTTRLSFHYLNKIFKVNVGRIAGGAFEKIDGILMRHNNPTLVQYFLKLIKMEMPWAIGIEQLENPSQADDWITVAEKVDALLDEFRKTNSFNALKTINVDDPAYHVVKWGHFFLDAKFFPGGF